MIDMTNEEPSAKDARGLDLRVGDYAVASDQAALKIKSLWKIKSVPTDTLVVIQREIGVSFFPVPSTKHVSSRNLIKCPLTSSSTLQELELFLRLQELVE